MPPIPTIDALIARYDGFLLDAYGVLVDEACALPGAVEFLARLDAAGRPWLILSNAASRLPETLSAGFAALGLAVPPERLLTSGGLLAGHFAAHGLVGARCLVVGPPTSMRYVEQAGGIVVPLGTAGDGGPAPLPEADVLVIADQQDLRFPDDLDLVLSWLLRRLDAPGQPPPALILCNPDLIYPCGPGRFGVTAGSIAALIEAVLAERYGRRDGRSDVGPDGALRFVRLGKPNRPLFEAGRRRLGGQRPVMLGDQLATDIAGAAAAGIDSVLVGTGLAAGTAPAHWPARPTWYLPSLVGDDR